MDDAFILLIGVMLLARAGFKRNVPMAAFYLASVGWAVHLVWKAFISSLDWILSVTGVVNQYGSAPSGFSVLSIGVSTVSGLALIVAVLIAARGSQVEPMPESAQD